MNFLALPMLALDPMAAISATAINAGSIETDTTPQNNAFLEMLLASEAAETITEVPTEAPTPSAPAVPAPQPVIHVSQEAVSVTQQESRPLAEERRDQVAAAYATVATMQAVELPPPGDPPVATGAVPTAPVAASVSSAHPGESISEVDWERSEEPEESEEGNLAPIAADKIDGLIVPVGPPTPSPIHAIPVHSKVAPDTIHLSGAPFVRPTQGSVVTPHPANPAISTDHDPTPTQSAAAPVILEAHITKKTPTENNRIAPNDATAPMSSELTSDETPRTQGLLATSAGSRTGSFEDAPEREMGQEDHSEQPPQEKAQSIDRPSFVQNAVTSGPATKPERSLPTETIRQSIPVADDRYVEGSERPAVKQIDVRIPDPNGDVTVRLQERAGSLHVSVRSADSQIANGVAKGLPELTRALDTEGFRTETWTPQIVSTPDAGTEESMSPVSLPRFEANGIRQPETSPAEDGLSDRQSEPDWQEQQDKRRKRQSDEDFKENLW